MGNAIQDQEEKKKDNQNKNKKALEKVCIAQPILTKIKANTGLVNVHDTILSELGDSRYNGHFVNDTLSEIMDIYCTVNYEDIVGKGDVDVEVQNFVREAYNYRFGGFLE